MTEAAPMEPLPHRGVLVFVLGILGLGVFFLFGSGFRCAEFEYP